MELLIEKHVMVPMRDGTRLATDIYRPADGLPAPTLLAGLPYGKDVLAILANPMLPDPIRLAEAGYAVAIQDTRGTFRSEGVFEPMVNEADDGVDSIAWAAAQPWSNGRVGMYGASYLGFTQWLAAREKPDELVALAPAVTTSDYHRAPWYHQGGLFELTNTIEWSLNMAAAAAVRSHSVRAEGADVVHELAAAASEQEPIKRRLPYRDQPLLDNYAPWYVQWLDHPGYDDFWRKLSHRESYEQVMVPALHIGGWYDICLGPTLDNFVGMKERGGTEAARTGQRLVIGPWSHAVSTGSYPDRSFGPAGNLAAQDVTSMHRTFFDHWMRGTQQAPAENPVRIFVMGIDEWRDEADWPLPDTAYTAFFLSSGGHANTAAGDGILHTKPTGSNGHDVIRYDPADPVPTVGGAVLGLSVHCPGGPFDQAAVEEREDVLCYSTPPLTRPVEVTGRVELVLFVSSTALDTDVTAKLVDVFPDGRAINLTEGALRLRYRNSPSDAELLTPGEVYEVRVDLWATSNVFLAGHRMRLEVASSNFPRFDRNTNTGGDISRDGPSALVVAVNKIYHGPGRPSRLILPLIDRT